MDASVGEAGQGDAKPAPSPPVHDFGSGRYSDYEAKWEPFVAGNFLVGGCKWKCVFHGASPTLRRSSGFPQPYGTYLNLNVL